MAGRLAVGHLATLEICAVLRPCSIHSVGRISSLPRRSSRTPTQWCSAGWSRAEPLPPLQQLSADEMVGGLDGLVTSINTAMQFSFFITKDMRRDLVSTRFRGVLPVILTFMARSGHTVESIDLVRLDGNGQPVLVSGSGGSAPGAMIRARGPGGLKRVLYFRQDLSDSGLSPSGPFLKFVSSLGRPPAFLKSASYLMHESGFSTIRNYLLSHCRGIVQCPSGVPYRDLLPVAGTLSCMGITRARWTCLPRTISRT